MSRTLTEVGPTLRVTLFRDEQRRRLTRPESRLAARGGSGLTHARWYPCASTGLKEEGRADPVREIRLVERYSLGGH